MESVDPGTAVAIGAVVVFFLFLGYRIYKSATKPKSTRPPGPGPGPRPGDPPPNLP